MKFPLPLRCILFILFSSIFSPALAGTSNADSLPLLIISTTPGSLSVLPEWAKVNHTVPDLYTVVQQGGEWTSSGTSNLRGYDWNILNGTLRISGTNGKFQIEDLHNQKRFQIYRELDTTYIGGQNTKYEYTAPIILHHDAPNNSFIMLPDKLQLNQPVEFSGGSTSHPAIRITNSVSLLQNPLPGSIENDGSHLYWTDKTGRRVELDNSDRLQLTQLRFSADSNLDQKIIFTSTPESRNGNAGIFWGQYRVNTTGPDTTNNVLSMGINWDQSRGTQEYIRLGMESHYENFGQPAWQEWHAPEIRTQDGTIFRPSSWIGPKGYPVGSWLYRAESLTWMNSIGTRQIFGFSEEGNFFSNAYGWPAASWRFSVHDNKTDQLRYGFGWQIVETGEVIFSGNVTSFGFNNPVIVNTNNGYGLMNILNVNHANGLYANGTQKRLYLAQGQFDASEFAYLNLTNTNNKTGSSVLQLQTHIESNGSPYIEYYVWGGKMWRMGIDNQDEQDFKIGVNNWDTPAIQINGNTGQLSIHRNHYNTEGNENVLTVKDGVISHKPLYGGLQYYDFVYTDSGFSSGTSPICIGKIAVKDNSTGTLSYEVNAHNANGDLAGFSKKIRFKNIEGVVTLLPEQDVVPDQRDAGLSGCSVKAIVVGEFICIQAISGSQNVSFRLNAGITYHNLPAIYL